MSSSNIINFNDSFNVLSDEYNEQNQPLINNDQEDSEKDTISHSSSSLYQMTRMETFSFIATHILYSKYFQYYYVFVILLSAVSIIMSYTMGCSKFLLVVIEGLILLFLILEVIIRLLALKKYYFYSFWNILDIVIIGICIFILSITRRKCEKGDNLIDNGILIFRYIVQIIRLGILLRKNQNTESRRNKIKSVNFGHIKKRKDYDSFTNIENKSYGFDNSIIDTGVGSISQSTQNFIFGSQTGYCFVDDNNEPGSLVKNIIKTDEIGIDPNENNDIDDDDDDIDKIEILNGIEEEEEEYNNHNNSKRKSKSYKIMGSNSELIDGLPPAVISNEVNGLYKPIIAPILSSSPSSQTIPSNFVSVYRSKNQNNFYSSSSSNNQQSSKLSILQQNIISPILT